MYKSKKGFNLAGGNTNKNQITMSKQAEEFYRSENGLKDMPHLTKSEIEKCEFAEAYHKEQLKLCSVGCSLPRFRDVAFEADDQAEKRHEDNEDCSEAYFLGFINCFKYIRSKI